MSESAQHPGSAFSGGKRRSLLLLLLFSLTLNLVGIGWGLGGAWTWAPDEIRPGQVLVPKSWSDKYPPLHRHLLTPIVKPARAALDAIDGLSWQDELAWLTLLQRLVSILAALGVVWLVFHTAREALGERAGLPAATVVALSPTFVYYAKTANLEMAYLFWFALSLLYFVRAWKSGRLRDFLVCSAAAIAAVTTKDQAYGLYPVLMAASLVRIARDHAHEPGKPGRPGWAPRWAQARATLTDRRLWGSVLVALVLFTAIYGTAGNMDDLVAHVEKIVGQNTMKYRVFEKNIPGFVEMCGSALRQTAFLIGWPLFALAGLGLALAARRWRDQQLLLVLALVPVGYVLSFVWVVGFHFVRFFLPLLPVLAIFAARGWLALADRFPRGARVAAVLVLAVALIRCVRVDAAMLTDTRIEAGRFLEARSPEETAVGVGRVPVLPRGIETVLWGQLRPRDCEFLERTKPDWVVFNANDLRSEREREILAGFETGQLNYDLDRRFLPRFEPPGWGSPMTNLSFVTPEIRVYRRADRPCFDKQSLGEVLNRKASRGDLGLERALIGLLLRENWGTTVDPEGRAALYGTTFGGWTRAKQPAILALSNPGPEPVGVTLVLAVAAGEEWRPIPVRVLDRGETRSLAFGKQVKTRTLTLADLAPGEERLVWFWSKRAWPGQEAQPRMLGVKLAKVSFTGATTETGATGAASDGRQVPSKSAGAAGHRDQAEPLPGQ